MYLKGGWLLAGLLLPRLWIGRDKHGISLPWFVSTAARCSWPRSHHGRSSADGRRPGGRRQRARRTACRSSTGWPCRRCAPGTAGGASAGSDCRLGRCGTGAASASSTSGREARSVKTRRRTRTGQPSSERSRPSPTPALVCNVRATTPASTVRLHFRP